MRRALPFSVELDVPRLNRGDTSLDDGVRSGIGCAGKQATVRNESFVFLSRNDGKTRLKTVVSYLVSFVYQREWNVLAYKCE